jgi:hypothetical protein
VKQISPEQWFTDAIAGAGSALTLLMVPEKEVFALQMVQPLS